MILGLGVVGLGVQFWVLGRDSLGLRGGVVGFWCRWSMLGHGGLGLGVGWGILSLGGPG